MPSQLIPQPVEEGLSAESIRYAFVQILDRYRHANIVIFLHFLNLQFPLLGIRVQPFRRIVYSDRTIYRPRDYRRFRAV